MCLKGKYNIVTCLPLKITRKAKTSLHSLTVCSNIKNDTSRQYSLEICQAFVHFSCIPGFFSVLLKP